MQCKDCRKNQDVLWLEKGLLFKLLGIAPCKAQAQVWWEGGKGEEEQLSTGKLHQESNGEPATM